MTDERTPLGRAVESAREARNLSVREAAARAGFSEGRWRQIVKGYQISGGHQVPANPRRRTVIAMAQAVGLDVNEALPLAGFDKVEGTSMSPPKVALDLAELLANDPSLDDESREHITNQYRYLQELTRMRSGQSPDHTGPGPHIRRSYPSDVQDDAVHDRQS